MGRKSDYNKQIENDLKSSKINEKELADKVGDKLHKEPISASELAIYMSVHSLCNKHFDSKTIKQRIEEICKMSGGYIEKKWFQENPLNTKSPYKFKPEIHGVLLTILDTNYFDNRKNEKRVGTREEFYKEITDNIDIYLQSPDKEIIKETPFF